MSKRPWVTIGAPRTDAVATQKVGKANHFMRARRQDMFSVCLSLRHYFATAAGFSLAINLLYLAAPLYMMQVYDRVLSSSSEATLAMLTVIVLVAFSTLAGLDCLRARILTRSATRLDKVLASRIFRVVMGPASRNPSASNQPVRDVETLRNFIAGNGMHAIFDFPWTPIYILIIYRLHPTLGMFALFSAVALVGMALINELWVRDLSARANEAGARAQVLSDQSLRNADVVHAMGMLGDLTQKWNEERQSVLSAQQVAGERAAIVASAIRFLRLAMQSLILGLGAWLVIERATSAGAMFAASILLGRALQPVEQAAGSWRSMVAARDAFRRLRRLVDANPMPPQAERMARPAGQLIVTDLDYVASGTHTQILKRVTFTAEAGDVIGIIGASGAGKSTLARLLVGVASASSGSIALAGNDVADGEEQLRRHIGYLPQAIELFADTVAANIARFAELDTSKIVRAAEFAGVHEMILRLPQGYQTMIGPGGTQLSGGWQQRIALARAAHGHPSLVVLDEPNSNLDTLGEESLAVCIKRLKQQQTTVIVISHRPAMLRTVDKILVMNAGTVDWFGPRDELLRRFAGNVAVHKGAAHASS